MEDDWKLALNKFQLIRNDGLTSLKRTKFDSGRRPARGGGTATVSKSSRGTNSRNLGSGSFSLDVPPRWEKRGSKGIGSFCCLCKIDDTAAAILFVPRLRKESVGSKGESEIGRDVEEDKAFRELTLMTSTSICVFFDTLSPSVRKNLCTACPQIWVFYPSPFCADVIYGRPLPQRLARLC